VNPVKAEFTSSPEAQVELNITADVAPTLPIRSTPISPPEPLIVAETFDTKASPLSNLRQLFDEEESAPIVTPVVEEIEAQFTLATAPAAPTTDRPMTIIIQSELAKRLDVHPSTIYKRRSEPDFTDWTRNRDPDGFAWGYAEVAKEYYQIDT
jgi:hypothetical protein